MTFKHFWDNEEQNERKIGPLQKSRTTGTACEKVAEILHPTWCEKYAHVSMQNPKMLLFPWWGCNLCSSDDVNKPKLMKIHWFLYHFWTPGGAGSARTQARAQRELQPTAFRRAWTRSDCGDSGDSLLNLH